MSNNFLNVALVIETCLALIVSYVYWIGYGLGTRPIAIPHLLIPALSYFGLLLMFDECRKLYMRAGIMRHWSGSLKLDGWVIRNSLY